MIYCCWSYLKFLLISFLLWAYSVSNSSEWADTVNDLLLFQTTFVKCILGRKMLSWNLRSILLSFLRLGGSLWPKDSSWFLSNFFMNVVITELLAKELRKYTSKKSLYDHKIYIFPLNAGCPWSKIAYDKQTRNL